MLPIIKKELRTYFTSMTGYAFLGFLVLLNAIYFVLVNIYNFSYGPNTNYQMVLSVLVVFFLFLIPALTMRLFSEEAKQKTDQLLFTSPVSVFEIVVGKYLAALMLFLMGICITMLFPVILSVYGELPTSQVVSSYIGYILLGASFISVGIFVSVLTDNQIISAVSTFATLFIFYILDSIALSMPKDRSSSVVFVIFIIGIFAITVYDATKNAIASGLSMIICAGALFAAYLVNNNLFDGLIGKALKWLSLLTRFQNFNVGILNLGDMVYYITFCAAFIYLTINVIEKRRYR